MSVLEYDYYNHTKTTRKTIPSDLKNKIIDFINTSFYGFAPVSMKIIKTSCDIQSIIDNFDEITPLVYSFKVGYWQRTEYGVVLQGYYGSYLRMKFNKQSEDEIEIVISSCEKASDAFKNF